MTRTNTMTTGNMPKPASRKRKSQQVAIEPATPAVVEPPARLSTKIATVIALLEREQGATISELTEATGWLPHTTRAALSGLRKKGHAIVTTKRDDVTCYRIGG